MQVMVVLMMLELLSASPGWSLYTGCSLAWVDRSMGHFYYRVGRFGNLLFWNEVTLSRMLRLN